jgi:hypothetical protein
VGQIYLLVIRNASRQVTSVCIFSEAAAPFLSDVLHVAVCRAAAVWCDVDDFIRSAVTGAPLVCHLLAVWQADCNRVRLHVTEGRNVFLPMVQVFNGLFLPVAEHNLV